MNVRSAESADRERIRAIAHDSLRSSYSLSPQQIEMIVEEEFSDGALAELLDDPDTTVLVATDTVEESTQVSGFVTVEHGPETTIRWLHVDPEARGGGIATALFDRVREVADGQSIAAYILEDAVEGGTFFEECGLEEDGYDHIEVGGEEFAVVVFAEGGETADPNEPSVPVPDTITVDGVARPVDRDDSVPGRAAPFFVLSDGDGEADAYGYFCSECGSTDVSADGLDRLECGHCGNAHLADEWDDAYL